MSNDEQFPATKAFAEVLDVPEALEAIKPERVLNPVPTQLIGKEVLGYTKEMTKNEFHRWANSNGVGSSYSGKKGTMFIFGENAPKVLEMAQGLTRFKVEIQLD